MNVIEYISKLLNLHDYVIIPGIGGFVANYKPAGIHPAVHRFTPPSKSLAFNKNLQSNDGLLVGHVARMENIAMHEASDKVNGFVQWCKDKLHNKEVLDIPGVGRLLTDVENNVRFIQDQDYNHLITSFGLPVFETTLVAKKEPIPKPAPAIVPLQTSDKTKEKKSPILRYAVFGILLIALSAVATYYLTDLSFQRKTDSILGLDTGPMLTDTPAFVEAKQEIKPVKSGNLDLDIDWSLIDVIAAIPAATVDDELPALPEQPAIPSYPVSVNNEIPKGYFAIMGAFGVETNATRLASKLKEDGKDAFIFPKTRSGLLRVGVFIGSDDVSQVQKELKYLQQNFQPEAWLLKNN